jgi:hypothetical protein
MCGRGSGEARIGEVIKLTAAVQLMHQLANRDF